MAAVKGAANKAPNAKKARLYNSRVIKTQLNDSSFETKERLNIPDFLQSRSFEIKSFELSQLKTKNASTTRVFQSLPRSLRRRAASHNVKRIPKRLRNRALKEMKNSITGVPPKKEHLRGRKLYRLNLRKKLLKLGGRLKLLRCLPGDNFYNRKLNMREKMKALNKEIETIQEEGDVSLEKKSLKKLNNSCGSYDNTGINEFAPKPRGNIKFHKRQSKFTWLPTHIWHSKRFHMIKQYGYQIPLSPTQKSFRLMNRQKRVGTVLVDTSYLNSLILEIKDAEKFVLTLLSLTKYVKKVPESVISGQKTYNDWIEINGYKVVKALIYSNFENRKILVRVPPSVYQEVFTALKTRIGDCNTIYDCSYALGSVEIIGPTAVNSLSKILHLYKEQDKELLSTWSDLAKINDPNIVPVGTTFSFDIMDPRIWKRPVNFPAQSDQEGRSTNDLIIQLSQWKSNIINKSSVSTLLDPEGRNESYKNQFSTKTINQKYSQTKDSSNSINSAYHDNSRIPVLVTKTAESTWSIVLPWYWVLPIWIKLIGVRGTKVGGLKQVQQINFEDNVPSFPQDFPFLKDGRIYNDLLGQITKKKYSAKPSSLQNRAAPDFSEDDAFVSPFNCDWERLKDIVLLKKYSKRSVEELVSTKPSFAQFDDKFSRIINSYDDVRQISKTLKSNSETPVVELFNKNNPAHINFDSLEVQNLAEVVKGKIPVLQVSLELVKDGTIKDGARIYSKSHSGVNYESWSFISLIGFVTSGTFNLSKGSDSGIGSVVSNGSGDGHEVLVRNIGASKMYPAKLRYIKN